MNKNEFQLIAEDKGHWHGHQPPFSPNDYEVEIFKELVKDKKPVCLLGMTKQLLPFCDFAVDISPVETDKKTIQCNWFDMTDHAEIMIGDGVLNLTEFKFLEITKKLCKTFACRVFQKKLPGMKYAKFFPQEFPYNPKLIPTQKDITIAVWEF